MPARKRARKTYTTPTKVAKKTLERAKARRTKKMIKSTLLKMSETKFTSYGYVIGTINHNSGALIDLWTNNASSTLFCCLLLYEFDKGLWGVPGLNA